MYKKLVKNPRQRWFYTNLCILKPIGSLFFSELCLRLIAQHGKSISSCENRLVLRSTDASVPFQWVTADNVYGVGVERTFRQTGIGYVLGGKVNRTADCQRSERYCIISARSGLASSVSGKLWTSKGSAGELQKDLRQPKNEFGLNRNETRPCQ